MEGFVFLHREIQTHWIYKDSDKFKFWCTLLFMANFKDNKFNSGNELIEVKRGSFITSIHNLSLKTLVSKDTIRYWLKLLENDHMIFVKSTTKFTQITICNYESYQDISKTDTKRKQNKTNNKHETTPIQQKNEEECLNNENNIKSWRESYDIYLFELRSNFVLLQNDTEWIKKRQKFHPYLDIMLSIEKAATDFWSTEEGWEYKKKSSSIKIDWKKTFTRALTFKSNQVPKLKLQSRD